MPFSLAAGYLLNMIKTLRPLVLAGLLGPGRGVTLSEGGKAVKLAEPVPLVERYLRQVVDERVDAFGEEHAAEGGLGADAVSVRAHMA